MIKKLNIFTDGASRGNSGKAAIAFVIKNSKGNTLIEYSEKIGTTTNNVAEYTALIRALEKTAKYKASEVNCFSDSRLLVNQLNGKYKVKKKHLKKLHTKVKNLEKKYKKVTYNHLNRDNQKIARVDKLANKELDNS